MVKPLRSILLVTNLKEYNKVAFDMAMSLATHYDAKLYLLHVMEKMPDYIESRIEWMLTSEVRDKLKEERAEEARKKMIGKNISSAVVRAAIGEYCERRGIDVETCGNPIREVVIREGDVVEEILGAADEFDCGMIVMAAHEGLFDKSAVSGTIRRTLKNAKVPVLTVPHAFGK